MCIANPTSGETVLVVELMVCCVSAKMDWLISMDHTYGYTLAYNYTAVSAQQPQRI